ncbi:hypothetical protein CsSME_00000258 [Camellia sinensis var. sinensis]
MKFKCLLVEAMMYLIIDVDEEELMGGKLIYCIINFFVEEEICYLTLMLWKLPWAWRQKVIGVPTGSTNRACSTSSTSWQSHCMICFNDN